MASDPAELVARPLVSFVVPAHNEERLLGATLRAIAEAARTLGGPQSAGEDRGGFEIVVVDDASDDHTAAIARAHGAHVLPVRCRQIAATRNAGAAAARADLLVFVDADTLVTGEVVRAAVAALRGGAVGGGCAFRFEGRLPLYARALAALANPLYRALGLASGCFLFCTRAAFEAAGGFDATLFGAEEGALSRALRRQGRFLVLREAVTTSGRKLRAYSGLEVLALFVRFAIAGRKALRQREGLDIWYGERRVDPK